MLSLVLLGLLASQAAAPVETGTFRLHKFAQAIGTETYTIARQDEGLTLESHFTFTDRGTTVPLAATLTASGDYTPRTFTIAGSTSRLSTIDVAVELTGASARHSRREGRANHSGSCTRFHDRRIRTGLARDGAHPLLEGARITNVPVYTSVGPCGDSRARR